MHGGNIMEYSKKELKDILDNHKLWLSTNRKEGSRADLRSANLSGADLRGADLRSADLRSADLYSADLRSADLYSADLRSANLYSADLRSANLSGADLYSADLRSADLRSASLEGAVLDEIKGKKIITFQAGRDFAYTCDGNIKIGCESHTIEYWVSNFEEIGISNKYTKDELKLYGDFIKYINSLGELA